MGMGTQKSIFLYSALLLLLTTPVYCGESIPPNMGELIDDYYDVGGSPELSASIMGKSEFESGDTSTLFIRLTNNGSVDRFETDEVPLDAGEFTDAGKELELEADVTTAVDSSPFLQRHFQENLLRQRLRLQEEKVEGMRRLSFCLRG